MSDTDQIPASGNSVTVRVRSGAIEIKYNGDRAFLSDDISTILDKIKELDTPMSAATGHTSELTDNEDAAEQSGHSVRTIADLLDVNTGPGLILAACVWLTYTANKGLFTREEILTQMQSATEYYDQAFQKYLSLYLGRLVKSGKLRSQATKEGKMYSVSKKTRDELINAIKEAE